MEYFVVKGTHDVILDEADAYTSIEEILRSHADSYGFREFRTPIIENSQLFLRSVGDSSDIVRKEMYTFLDKGNRSITLRPEVTAGTIRAMVNNKLFSNQDFPVKAYYTGPNFRYERPGLGRYRQFNQFGVESVGADSYLRDVEVIELAYSSLRLLGFNDVTIVLNTLGDEETKENYKKALLDYFKEHIENMCSDCKERYNLNPLRILDCKVESDKEIIKDAPNMMDYLSAASKARFENLIAILDYLEIPYHIDPTLVRGLDYYSESVFELHYVSKKGIDYGAIGAGGHYSNLVGELGGPKLAGVGFALGIERLYNILKDDNSLPTGRKIDAYIMPMDEKMNKTALQFASVLRINGFSCEVNLEGSSLKNCFKKAERRGATFALIIGENELANESVMVKKLKTHEQTEVKLDNLIEYLDAASFEDANLDEFEEEKIIN